MVGIRVRIAPMTVIVFMLAAALPVTTQAQLSAYFRAESLDYNGDLQDCDPCPFCQPVCELYFEMGIAQAGATSFVTGPDYCPDPGYASVVDGVWDFTDRSTQRTLSDMSSSAQFGFSLYDEDPGFGGSELDDLLGSHTMTLWGPVTSILETNNDVVLTGYSPNPCERSTANISLAGQFALQYSVWFVDDSAPAAPGKPAHYDSPAPIGWDDDATLEFSFASGSDPNSGISDYRVELWEDGAQIYNGYIASANPEFSVCASGCTISHAVLDGSTYHTRARSYNGAAGVVDISNRSLSMASSWSEPVVVDSTNPSSSISSPAPGSLQSDDFSVVWTDSDANAIWCQIAIMNDSDIPGAGDWSVGRTCDAPYPVTVGLGRTNCSWQGTVDDDVCWVWGRTIDDAGNATITSIEFAIDFANPTSAISSPAPESLQSDDFPVVWTDADATAITCEIAVMNSAAAPGSGDWSTRTCNASSTVTVGAGPTECGVEGSVEEDICWVWGRATDAAGNATITSIEFAIAYTINPIPVPAASPALLSLLAVVLAAVGSRLLGRREWATQPIAVIRWR